MTSTTNLRVLRRNRPKVRDGYLFRWSMEEDVYFSGMVLRANTDGVTSPWEKSHLVYLYDVPASQAIVTDALRPNRLIVPPAFVHQRCWTNGYFEPFGHVNVCGEMLLPHPCFEALGSYRDDYGRSTTFSEPCGLWAMIMPETVDDRLSDALGIPRAPL